MTIHSAVGASRRGCDDPRLEGRVETGQTGGLAVILAEKEQVMPGLPAFLPQLAGTINGDFP